MMNITQISLLDQQLTLPYEQSESKIDNTIGYCYDIGIFPWEGIFPAGW